MDCIPTLLGYKTRFTKTKSWNFKGSNICDKMACLFMISLLCVLFQPQLDMVNKRMREVSHEMNGINHHGEEIRIAVDNHHRAVKCKNFNQLPQLFEISLA